MDTQLFAELIQRDLKAAVFNSDEEAIERFSLLISDKINKIEEVEKEQETTKSDIRLLIETVKQGFEEVNKRFETMQHNMDKRFEMMFKFMSLGFTVIALLIAVFKFIH